MIPLYCFFFDLDGSYHQVFAPKICVSKDRVTGILLSVRERVARVLFFDVFYIDK